MTEGFPGTANAHRYWLFGLALRCDFALPELDPRADVGAATIEIRAGRVAETADDGTPQQLVATSDGAILTIAGIARFHIRDGREIVVDPHPSASERDVRLFLLGSAMGALLHQRGSLPLHANGVDIGGKATAFLGHSGAGKSTLAAAFHDAGYGLLSDDVCVVERNGDGFVAQPGIPRLRLWRDAIERSGRDTVDHERAFDAIDKYTVQTAAARRSDALPLGAIFLLTRHEDAGQDFAIRRLAGAEAIRALMENTYRGSFIEQVGDPRRHFETCIQLSRAVPIFELRRPWDQARIGAVIAHVERHLAAL